MTSDARQPLAASGLEMPAVTIDRARWISRGAAKVTYRFPTSPTNEPVSSGAGRIWCRTKERRNDSGQEQATTPSQSIDTVALPGEHEKMG